MNGLPSRRLRRSLPLILAGMLCLAGALPSRAEPQAVVLASTAPDYLAGDLLDTLEVDVPDGANTVFLLASGQSITIKGPYRGKLLSEQKQSSPPGMGLLAVIPDDESEIGGTRSLIVHGPTFGDAEVDLSVADAICLSGKDELHLVRPSDPAFRDLELTDPNSGQNLRLSWSDNDVTNRPWPFAGQSSGRTELLVRSLRTGTKRRIALERFREAPKSEAALAARLALAGCQEQAQDSLARLGRAIVPLDLYLTTSQGRNPTFRRGERIELTLQVNRDSFVYCFIRDSNGRVLPIFPPQPDAAAVEGHRPLSLPDRTSPIVLEAGASLHDSEIRCVATERDLGDQVPDFTLHAGLQPLSKQAAHMFARTLSDPGHGGLVMAQLILRVEP